MDPGTPAASFVPEGLFHDLLQVSLTAVNVLRPVHDPAGEIVDFTLDYLNPAAQRMSVLPERPGGTLLTLRPGTASAGIFDYYRRVFTTGAADVHEVNYQAEGLDNYFRLAARRSGEWLVVSFTDTADQDRSAVEVALRDAQAAERAARAEAEAQRQRLHKLLLDLPAIMATYRGPDHVYDLVSPPFQQLFPTRSLPGRPIREALPELAGQGLYELLDRVYHTGEPYYGQEVPTQVDYTNTGRLEQRYHNMFFQVTRDDQGAVDGLLSFAYDVTEQVLARQQVLQLNQELEARVQQRTRDAERARQRLHDLFLQAPAAICILDGPDLVYELVNPGYQELFPGRQLLGRPLLDALPEIAGHAVYRTFRQVYDTGATHAEMGILIPLVRPDGVLEDRYFNYIQQARRDADGRVDGVLVFAFEVTEQVRARQASEDSAQRLRLLTDALPALIGYVDNEEKYRFVNRAYEGWFNQPAEALVGQPIHRVAGELAYAVIAPYIRRALAGERVEFVAEMPFRPGFTKHIRTAYVPDERAGRVEGFYTLVSDITEQVEARQQVDALNQQLRAANEDLHGANDRLTRTNVDLDTFIYTASHDLKAPITNIEGLLDALRHELPRAALAGDVPEMLQLMQQATERFQRTIEQLTDVSKLQQAHGQLATQVPLAGLVEEVRLDLQPLIRQIRAQLTVDVPPTARLPFSEKNLRSVVYNLLSNALKYHAPERAPQVMLRYHREDLYHVLRVHDNGLGLDLTHGTDKLFGLFQRLHSHVEGTGIGLYMVKKMVENGGGRIEVRSQPDVGTTFSVFFPVHPVT